eukprot:11500558-Prorocentrum_lima.AAC.1
MFAVLEARQKRWYLRTIYGNNASIWCCSKKLTREVAIGQPEASFTGTSQEATRSARSTKGSPPSFATN